MYRSTLGWSQAKLAEKVNSSTQYIGMIEIGLKFPSPEMIEKLAHALGIESPQLFSKETVLSESEKHYRKTILKEISGLVNRFIEGKIQELDDQSEKKDE